MKIALNVMLAIAAVFCFMAGALYFLSKVDENYVEIYSNEHV